MWDEIIERKEHFTVEYPFPGLNKMTYGMRLSELVVVTADTGVGKTSFLKHIEHKLLTDETVKEQGYGVGFLHFEEPNGDTALGLLSIHNGVPYHLPDVDRDPKDLRNAYDEVLNNNRAVIWDHFGSNSVDAVINKIRHMSALGCKYIVVDHLSIIVSDQSGDERKQLDEISTKIKTLCMELDVAVLAVIHTNRQGQIRGTAGVEQLANIVLRLERDKTDPNEWRRNVTKITVEKNRFCGYTGPASYLWYNAENARLSELEREEVEIFEAGGSIHEADKPWKD
jgi:twinkle protein